MGRTIINEKPVSPHAQGLNLPQQSGEADSYATKIVKLIPADIVAVYLGLQSLFSGITAEGTRFGFQLAVFIIILVLAPFFLKRVAGVTDERQVIVVVISYVIWGISLGGPFQYLLGKITEEVSAQQIGGGLVMLYTLIVPMVYGGKPANPVQPPPKNG